MGSERERFLQMRQDNREVALVTAMSNKVPESTLQEEKSKSLTQESKGEDILNDTFFNRF